MNSEENFRLLKRPDNLDKLGIGSFPAQLQAQIRSAFALPSQRLCRYFLFVRQFVGFVSESTALQRAAGFLQGLKEFVTGINEDKSVLDSIRNVLIVQNAIEGRRLNLCAERRLFLGKCDCVDAGTTYGITLVLFTDMVLLLQRDCGPAEIEEIDGRTVYKLVKAVMVENIDVRSTVWGLSVACITDKSRERFTRLPGSRVVNGHTRVRECAAFRAHSIREKRLFVKSFHMLRRNDEGEKGGGRLFFREARHRVFFYVHEIASYNSRQHERDALVVFCEEDIDKVLSRHRVPGDQLLGVVRGDGSFCFSSTKGFRSSSKDAKNSGRDAACEFWDCLCNMVELHQRLPAVSTAFAYRFRDMLEDLARSSASGGAREKNVLRAKDRSQTRMLCFASQKTCFLLRHVEKRLLHLRENGSLMGVCRGPASRAGMQDPCRPGIPLAEALYRRKVPQKVVSLYSKLCSKRCVGGGGPGKDTCL